MAAVTIKLTGTFRKDLNRFIQRYPHRVDKVLRETASFASKRIIKDTPVQTGAARQSWNIKKESTGRFAVVSNIGRGSQYTPYLEFGTGRFGPKNRDIKPRAAKFLHFPIVRKNTIVRWVKTKSVKGIKPFKMIEKNLGLIEKKKLLGFKTMINRLWGGR